MRIINFHKKQAIKHSDGAERNKINVAIELSKKYFVIKSSERMNAHRLRILKRAGI